MFDVDYTLMPEEVTAYLKDKEETNRKCGYDMFKLIDIDCNPVEKPDGEMYSDSWAVTIYNKISCMMFCKSWCIFYEAGERKVVTSYAELPMDLAKKIAKKIQEVA